VPYNSEGKAIAEIKTKKAVYPVDSRDFVRNNVVLFGRLKKKSAKLSSKADKLLNRPTNSEPRRSKRNELRGLDYDKPVEPMSCMCEYFVMSALSPMQINDLSCEGFICLRLPLRAAR
jgi:hypothetical protein